MSRDAETDETLRDLDGLRFALIDDGVEAIRVPLDDAPTPEQERALRARLRWGRALP